MLIPPHEISAHAIGVRTLRSTPEDARSKHPRVTSKMPLEMPTLKLSGNPTALKIVLIAPEIADRMPKLFNTSMSIKNIAMYPPTSKIEIIESYMVLDKMSCVSWFKVYVRSRLSRL